MERMTTRRPRRGGGEKASPAAEVTPARSELSVAPAAEVKLLVPVETPEPVFAARVPPPAPERRRPTTRHAIFFDVENTSHPAHIEGVIERLAIDHLGRSTEFVAVGNWRVIGHETARLLARHGAQLVHSAPSTGVRDWSDLRIAVSAGVWLAGAHPGDVIEIVSDDRAFDAVGDVAASLGITFHRLTARTLAGAAPEPAPAPPQERGRRRTGRRRRHGSRAHAPVVEVRREADGAQPPLAARRPPPPPACAGGAGRLAARSALAPTRRVSPSLSRGSRRGGGWAAGRPCRGGRRAARASRCARRCARSSSRAGAASRS